MRDRNRSQDSIVPSHFLGLMLSESHFEFRVVHTFCMLIQLGTSGPAGNRENLWHFKQDIFNAASNSLALA